MPRKEVVVIEEPEHVQSFKKVRVRVTGRGFANNHLFEEKHYGAEVEFVIDVNAKKASWYEVLEVLGDAKGPVNVNFSDFAKAETPGITTGYAAGHSVLS